MSATDITSLLRSETSRLEQLLRTVSFGNIGLHFVLHHGEVTRVIRSQDISMRPAGAPGSDE